MDTPQKAGIEVQEISVSQVKDMEDPDVEKEAQQPCPLLRLPVEILQIVQRHMTVASFYISLITCKRLLHAAVCRPLVLKHLHSMPGLGLGLDSVTTGELLTEFRKRAKESGHAAGILAHRSTYAVKPGCMISKAVFTPHDPWPVARGKQTIMAVPFASGIIQLYELVDDKFHIRRSRGELHIRPEDGNMARLVILKLAFAPGSRDLAVLYRHVRSTEELKGGIFNPLRESGGAYHEIATTYKLVVFQRLHTKSKGYFYCSAEQETRDIPFRTGPIPIGLALAPNGTACISWTIGFTVKCCMVWLVHRVDDWFQEDCKYDPSPPLTKVRHRDIEVGAFDMQFAEKGRRLDLYARGNPLPHWYATINEGSNVESVEASSPTYRIDVHQNEREPRSTFSIGTPFHERHTSGVTVDWDPGLHCARSYLALGTTTADTDDEEEVTDLFILKREILKAAGDCDHLINHEKGRNLTGAWTPVALLSGFLLGNTSLGTILAISPGGTRVAASVWRHIYLWSFNPDMMLDGGQQLYFPARDYNSRKGFGRIRPSLISCSGGVVHSMLWAGENILFAITDQGLTKWDLGCILETEEEKLSLIHDTWPNNALSVAAPGTGDKLPIPRTLLEDFEREVDDSD